MGFTRYYGQDVLVAANTPIAAPVVVSPILETNRLQRIEIDVPDGHDRLTGIRFVSDGTVIVPFSASGWIVANDHYFVIPFDDDITKDDITVQAYNTDVYAHTFYVRFVVSNTTSGAVAGIVSGQVPGTVAPGAAETVAGLSSTPGVLAVADIPAPAPVPLTAPQAPTGGEPG